MRIYLSVSFVLCRGLFCIKHNAAAHDDLSEKQPPKWRGFPQ
jgi:hypothetical protein